ncbi:MAG: TonB-dependent receptor plug domain-containing protein, partial [Flexibacteraceae bacterium]
MAVPFVALAQKAKGIVKGKIYNTEGEVVPYVSIQEIRTNTIVQASSVGEFQIKLPSDTALILEFRALGYAIQRFPIQLKPREVKELSPYLVSESKEFDGAVIKEDRNRNKISTITLNPKDAKVLPSPFGDFNAIFKTLPGVVSNNELSSAYSVRGGSFDENLVYVNDIEIYRPQLVGSGQQEGLSFVNTDLVKNVEFSSGGFQPRYGDKLSSVLNIEYKTPTKWAGNATASLLYQAFSVEGVSKNERLSFVAGVRQKTAQYLFLGLDVKGQYFPRFFDAQTYITYDLTSEAQKKRDSKTTIGFLASYARNRYLFRPESQETEFGTLNSKLRFEVGYIGEETMYYDTWQNGLKLSHTFNNKLRSDFTFSQVYTQEREYIDVEGGYRLCDVQSDPSRNNFNECIALRAIG